MICAKCKGQRVVTKIVQLDGEEGDNLAGFMFAALTTGLSLLFTTRLKEVRCPRCGGTGRVGIE